MTLLTQYPFHLLHIGRHGRRYATGNMTQASDVILSAECGAGLHTGARILIVEDCPDIRALYRQYLARSGRDYLIYEAATVEEGLAVLSRESVDCVLLDYCLPDTDGLHLLTGLCDSNDGYRVPVVMITGQGDEAIAVEAMKAGAMDYLVKRSIDQDGLVAALDNALAKARAESEKSDYLQKLERESITDPLTGLYNRRYLFNQLGVELQRSARYAMPLCLLLIDLDHFKSVNDERGHVTGDRVLERFAGTLNAVARATDLVARYGGEEFCVVLTNTDIAGGRQFAERVLVDGRELVHVDSDGGEFKVSCSIGIVQGSAADVSAEALLARCDRALYAAKNNGRDRVCVGVTGEPALASAG